MFKEIFGLVDINQGQIGNNNNQNQINQQVMDLRNRFKIMMTNIIISLKKVKSKKNYNFNVSRAF